MPTRPAPRNLVCDFLRTLGHHIAQCGIIARPARPTITNTIRPSAARNAAMRTPTTGYGTLPGMMCVSTACSYSAAAAAQWHKYDHRTYVGLAFCTDHHNVHLSSTGHTISWRNLTTACACRWNLGWLPRSRLRTSSMAGCQTKAQVRACGPASLKRSCFVSFASRSVAHARRTRSQPLHAVGCPAPPGPSAAQKWCPIRWWHRTLEEAKTNKTGETESQSWCF